MDSRPTTEEAGNLNPNQRLDDPEVKSGVRLWPKVSELRRKLADKAKQEPRFRFYALYDRIYRQDVLSDAWSLVLAHNGAPGVDGMTCQDIIDGPGATVFLDELQEELRTGSYRPNRSNASTFPSRTADCDRWGFPRSKTGSFKRRLC